MLTARRGLAGLCVLILVLVAGTASATDVSGAINADTVWTLAGSPWVMTSDVVVNSGFTLTVEPGATIHGRTNAGLTVRGTLRADGTEGQPITFRGENQTPGAWDGVVFDTGGAGSLLYVRIQDATDGIEITAPNRDNQTFSHVAISGFSGYGIELLGTRGSATFSGMDIDAASANNGTALRAFNQGVNAAAPVTLDHSWIRNARYGIYSDNSHIALDHTIFSDNTDGVYHRATTSGTWRLTAEFCTFYGHTNAIQQYRSSSNNYTTYVDLSYSIFGQNGTVVRDQSSSSYPLYVAAFDHNLYWANGSLSNRTLTPTAGLAYNALLSDPDNGDFEPTNRSPARYYNPADPAATLGAVPYAGAQTGAGVHGFHYDNIQFATLSQTEVTGDLVVAPGVTVNFQPGAELILRKGDIMAGGLDDSLVEIRVEGTLEADGTISRPVKFRSGEDPAARADWYGIVIPSNAQAFNVAQVDIGHARRGVFLSSNDHIVAGSTIHDCSEAAVYIDGGTPEIEQVIAHDNSDGMYIINSATVETRDSTFRDNDDEGIYVYNSSLTLERSQVYGNGDDGIESYIATGNRTLTLDNVTLAHNNGEGLYHRRGSSANLTTIVRDTSVTHNGGYGIRDGSSTSYPLYWTCDQSNIWGNGSPYTRSPSAGTCHAYNPLYVNGDAGDYAPTRHSPLVHLGTGGGTTSSVPHAARTLTGNATTLTLADNEGSSAITLGFNFDFYGSRFTEAFVSSNGFLSFQSDGITSATPQLLPTPTAPNALIAGYWEDLNPAEGGTIRYELQGSAPDREFVVAFDAVPHAGSNNLATFQIVLQERLSAIEIHCASCQTDGGRHTQGVESPSGASGLFRASNRNYASFSLTNDGARFTPADLDDALVGAVPYGGVTGPRLMGYLWEDFTFTQAGSPWPILGDIIVPKGVTVTFEAGARLQVVPDADGMGGGRQGTRAEIRFLPGSLGLFPSEGDPVVFAPDTDTPMPGDWQGLHFEDPDDTVVENVEVRYATIGIDLLGPRAAGVENVLLLHNDSYGVGATNITSDPDVDVLAARIVGDGGGTGVNFQNADGDVRSSYITHHSRGIDVNLTTSRTTLVSLINNTIVHHQYGIEYGRSSSYDLRMTIYNNVIAASTTAALRDASSQRISAQVRYNNFFDSATLSNVGGTVSNNVTSAPLIEDDDWDTFPRWWDGKLWANSLAINAGSDAAPNLPTRDLFGRARNFAGGVDMGAYEHDPDANEEPRADAVTNSIIVPRGESFTVDGSAAFDPDGQIASAYWTFSDGTVRAGLTVNHTFAQDGANQWGYITVQDNEGAEDHALVNINVDIRPIADAGPDVFADEGDQEPVFFDGTLSTDPDGTIVSWLWNFGDGSPTSTEQSPRHNYLDAGQYIVTLTVTDNEGLTDVDTTIATIFGVVDNIGPLIQHNEIADGQPLGQPVTVQASITDQTGVASAVVFFRITGQQQAQFATMSNVGGSTWQGTIPGNSVTAAGVQYWITAQDSADQANTSNAPSDAPQSVFDFAVLGDPDPPTITHTPVAEGNPGEAIVITATVTDATGVDGATLYFRHANAQTFGAVSMTNPQGNTWTANIPGFVVASPGVRYYIEATDTSPIPNRGTAPANAPTQTYAVSVGGDTDPPLIAHTPVSNGQPEGRGVVVTATIVDNDSPIASGTIYYRPTGQQVFLSAAMQNINNDNWQGTIPAGSVTLAGVDYYVSGTDDADNTATHPPGAPNNVHQFTVSALDQTGPSITHTPVPNGQTAGVGVVVTAIVTDPSGVASVRLYYRPSGFPFYQDFQLTQDGDTWSGTIPDFAVTEPGVQYYLRATDQGGNATLSPPTAPATPHSFTVGSADDTAPGIAHTPIANGRPAGVALVVSATVVDASGVEGVQLYYRVQGFQNFTTVAAARGNGDVWSATVPAGAVIAPGLEYYLRAIDASANANVATDPAGAPQELHSFTVVNDTEGPAITHTPVANGQQAGIAVTLTGSVTDETGVASLALYYRPTGSQNYTNQGATFNGNAWSVTIPSQDVVEPGLEYYLTATDTWHEPNTSRLPDNGTYSFTVQTEDNAPPVVQLIDPPPVVTEGQSFNIRVQVTDDSPITQVRLYHRIEGQQNYTVLTRADQGEFTIPGNAVAQPRLEIYAEADDGEGNTGTTLVTSIPVNPPPDVTPPVVALDLVPDGQLADTPVTVTATITDNVGVLGANLYYRTQGQQEFQVIGMNGDGDLYQGLIPQEAVVEPGVDYYVIASDGAGNLTTAPQAPASFTVTPDDQAGPSITHVPEPGPVDAGATVAISATVTDASGVAYVRVLWRTRGDNDFVPMPLQANGDVYSGAFGPVTTPGVEYRIEAGDDRGNSSAHPGVDDVHEFDVEEPDTEGPTISHTPFAQPLLDGATVAVSATVTDRSGVASVDLLWRTGGDQNFQVVSLTAVGDVWSGQVGPVGTPGMEYYFTAMDMEANQGVAPQGAPNTTFDVDVVEPDNEGPAIAHTPLTDPVQVGSLVDVAATVTDPAGVRSVTLYWRLQGGQAFNAVPLAAEGDAWSVRFGPVAQPGIEYYLGAQDGLNNQSVAPLGAPGAVYGFSVFIPDTTAPSIQHTPNPGPLTEGDPHLVSAVVTDASGVNAVTLSYRASVNDAFEQLAMVANGDTYTATIPGAAVAPPVLGYFISASDIHGNTARRPAEAQYAIQVGALDLVGPTIVHDPVAEPVAVGSMVRIDATVTDPAGVTAVNLHWRVAGSPAFNQVAIPGDGDQYTTTFGPVAAPSIEYFLSASDGEGNPSTEPDNAPDAFHGFDVFIPDTIPPVIVHTPRTAPAAAGTFVDVSATMTDAGGVTGGTLYWRVRGLQAFNQVPLQGDGDTWSVTYGPVAGEGIEYYLAASDAAGNGAVHPPGAPGALHSYDVFVPDATAPIIEHTPAAGPLAAGADHEIVATITDDTAVTEAYVYYRTTEDGEFVELGLDGDADEWSATLPGDEIVAPVLAYYLVARDAAGNETRRPRADANYEIDVDGVDVEGPSIVADAIESPVVAGTTLAVGATITDSSGVARAEVLYRHAGEDAWESSLLAPDGEDHYAALIPGSEVTEGELEVSFTAEDSLGNMSQLDEPVSVTIDPAEVEDTTAPSITHSPVGDAPLGEAINIEATVTDATGVASVKLYFRAEGESAFVTAAMTSEDGAAFVGTIPAFAAGGTGVEYYIEAVDSAAAANLATDPVNAPDAVYTIVLMGDDPDVGNPDTGDDVGSEGDTSGGDDTGVTAEPADDTGCGCRQAAAPSASARLWRLLTRR